MAQQSFNPYEYWLGIAGAQPTNFYELLGVRLFENNVQAISQAIDARTMQIRGVRPGLHVAEWERVLAQLNLAKAALLDPAAKARYDATLRGNGTQAAAVSRSESRAAAAEPPRAIPAAAPWAPAANVPPSPIFYAAPVSQPAQPPWNRAPMAVPLAPYGKLAPVAGGQPVAAGIPGQPGTAGEPNEAYEMPVGEFSGPRSQPRRQTRRQPVALGAPAVLIVLIAVAGALAYQLYQKREKTAFRGQTGQAGSGEAWQRRSAEPSTSRSDIDGFGQETPALAQSTPGSNPSGRRLAEGVAAKPSGSKMADVGRSPAGANEAGNSRANPAFRAAAKKVFSAMSAHDVERARRELKAAVAMAKTESEKAETARLDLLITYLEEFWKGMSRVVAGLEGGEVFTFNDEPIVVVEGTTESLVLRGRGQNREYSIRSIPALMVMRLAETYLRTAESRAQYGVFQAVDPKGDPERARRLWQTAARAGVNVQPLLDMDLAQFVRAGEREARSDAGDSAKVEPPTDEVALRAAQQMIRERFTAGYQTATTAAGKADLAEQLMKAAANADDVVLRFAMFREAENLAVSAGKLGLAQEVVDALAGFYAVEPLEKKIAILEEVGKTARGLQDQKEIAEEALVLWDQAMKASRSEEAKRLAEVAFTAAQKSRSAVLMKAAKSATEQIEGAARQE